VAVLFTRRKSHKFTTASNSERWLMTTGIVEKWPIQFSARQLTTYCRTLRYSPQYIVLSCIVSKLHALSDHHGTAPRYLQDVIEPITEVTSRHWLRSASSSALLVPATRRSTLEDRAFTVAGPWAWNSLPEFVTDCSSPLTFKKYLKTYLFSLSFLEHEFTV